MTRKENNQVNPAVQPISIFSSLAYFLIPTALLFLAVYVVAPALRSIGFIPVAAYFASLLPVLIGLFLTALFAVKREQGTLTLETIKTRLRLGPLTKRAWLWIGGTLIVMSIASGLVMVFMQWLGKATGWFTFNAMPSSLHFGVIPAHQWWVFLVHLPYLFFNIFGEEFLWRGYLLPRQELNHDAAAWVVNGLLWTVLHAFVGLPLVTMLPLMFAVPLAVQKTGNTWCGIIIHLMFAGGGFWASSLGLMQIH